jgi:hypothetical protein
MAAFDALPARQAYRFRARRLIFRVIFLRDLRIASFLLRRRYEIAKRIPSFVSGKDEPTSGAVLPASAIDALRRNASVNRGRFFKRR